MFEIFGDLQQPHWQGVWGCALVMCGDTLSFAPHMMPLISTLTTFRGLFFRSEPFHPFNSLCELCHICGVSGVPPEVRFAGGLMCAEPRVPKVLSVGGAGGPLAPKQHVIRPRRGQLHRNCTQSPQVADVPVGPFGL